MLGIVAHDPEFVLEIRSRDLSLYLIHSGEILSLSLCYLEDIRIRVKLLGIVKKIKKTFLRVLKLFEANRFVNRE